MRPAPKAKAAALKALELDSSIAEAHFTLAGLDAWTDWDWAGAEREFRHAFEIDPSSPVGRASYSHYLNMMHRPDEAMAQIERALALDPFNALVQSFYAIDLIFAHRYDDAIAAAHHAPDNPVALTAVWYARSLKGMQKETLEAAKAYVKVNYDDRAVEDALDQGYAQGGYTEGMKRGAQALAARFRTSFALPTDVAGLYLDARQNAQALDWLEKGLEVRDPNLPYLWIPYYDRLHSESRFQALMRKMNLPQ